MKHVLVTGGTGNLGRWVVEYLLQKNYAVGVLSSRTGVLLENGVTVFKGDLAANTGLNEATAEADIVIHCASNPRNFEETDVVGTKNLLNAINRTRTRHFVYISIVGVDKSSYPYYQAKYRVEKLIANSGVPYTLLRTTQFHSFILNIAQPFVQEPVDGIITIPAGMQFQSIDIREVAERLVSVAESPLGLLRDFGGPEVLPFEEMVKRYLAATDNDMAVHTADIAGERYNLFRSGINLCPEHADGTITWNHFLEEQVRASKSRI